MGGHPAHRTPGARGAHRHLATSQPVHSGAPLPRPTRQVCVLVPTRDESGNVAALLSRLGPVLTAVNGEVLFVDDSDDDTPSVITTAGRAAGGPVRMLHRAPGERLGGLGGAVQAGLATVTAPWTVVMDADLQHPPERIPDLLAAAGCGADLVVASRYSGNGTAKGLSSQARRVGSSGATGLARLLFPRILAPVTDPMSGFFAVRTAAIDPVALRPRGFKILLEVLVRTPQLQVAEVPFEFAERHVGKSKASAREMARYLRHLVALRITTADRPRLVRATKTLKVAE